MACAGSDHPDGFSTSVYNVHAGDPLTGLLRFRNHRVLHFSDVLITCVGYSASQELITAETFSIGGVRGKWDFVYPIELEGSGTLVQTADCWVSAAKEQRR